MDWQAAAQAVQIDALWIGHRWKKAPQAMPAGLEGQRGGQSCVSPEV